MFYKKRYHGFSFFHVFSFLIICLIPIMIFLVITLPNAVHAATHTVCEAGPPTCDFSSIQSAIDASDPGDTIQVMMGTYTGTENEVVLIRQYRHGIRDVPLEIPGGLVEGKDTPEEAAIRELREETGYEASAMIPLGKVLPNPAIQNNRCYTYLAKDVVLAGEQQLDDQEDIEVLCRPFEEVPRLIREGVVSHSLVVAAFFKYYLEYEECFPL